MECLHYAHCYHPSTHCEIAKSLLRDGSGNSSISRSPVSRCCPRYGQEKFLHYSRQVSLLDSSANHGVLLIENWQEVRPMGVATEGDKSPLPPSPLLHMHTSSLGPSILPLAYCLDFHSRVYDSVSRTILDRLPSRLRTSSASVF